MPAKKSDPAEKRDAQVAYLLSIDRLLDAAEKVRRERTRFLATVMDGGGEGDNKEGVSQ